MRTKFCQNYFLGKGFGKTSPLHSNTRELFLSYWVWGMNAGGQKLYKTGGIEIRNIQKIEFVINCNYEKRN